MKTAIAMKCTQEQFDAVKEKLIGCRPFMIDEFEKNDYLVCFEDKSISNGSFLKGTEIVYETWNEQIFLEACGIEPENIFKAGELQFMFDGKWCDTSRAYRLKPNNSAEIEALEKQKLKIDKQIEKLR